MLGDFVKHFDTYSRNARLYPAMIAMAPLVITYLLLHSPDTDTAKDLLGIMLAVAIALGVNVLLSQMARTAGKVIEPKLISAWGAWPSTIMLRHRDTSLDAGTKRRYHTALSVGLADGVMPTVEQERDNPGAADEKYREVTTWLMGKRRDRKYSILHSENAGYGFRRNLLGLKPVGMFLSAVCALYAVVFVWLGLAANHATITTDIADRWQLYMAAGLNVFIFAFWGAIVSAAFVRAAGDAYALALFRTLDQVE